jgi:hypothetical protein
MPTFDDGYASSVFLRGRFYDWYFRFSLNRLAEKVAHGQSHLNIQGGQRSDSHLRFPKRASLLGGAFALKAHQISTGPLGLCPETVGIDPSGS